MQIQHRIFERKCDRCVMIGEMCMIPLIDPLAESCRRFLPRKLKSPEGG